MRACEERERERLRESEIDRERGRERMTKLTNWILNQKLHLKEKGKRDKKRGEGERKKESE
jgi:hypothetical protein